MTRAVGCISAVGQVIPSSIIFDVAKLNLAWIRNEVQGSRYGLSSKGWILIQNHSINGLNILQSTVPTKPLLLLLDGYSSHQPKILRRVM